MKMHISFRNRVPFLQSSALLWMFCLAATPLKGRADSVEESLNPEAAPTNAAKLLALHATKLSHAIHGDEQARALLQDRFMMRAYRTKDGALHLVTEESTIFQWLSAAFGGSETEEYVFWNNLTSASARADHAYPTPLSPGYIRISPVDVKDDSNLRLLTFEELWRCAVFELISLRRIERWEQLKADVRNGRLSKQEFVEANAHFEYESLQKTVEFYKKTWLPWSISTGFQPDNKVWEVPMLSYEEWRKRFTDRAGYPWVPFEEMFDWLEKHDKQLPRSRVQ